MSQETRNIVTLSIDTTTSHWLTYLSERLGKSKIQLMREIMQALYRTSKVKGQGSLNITTLEVKKINAVLFRFTKSTNVEGENSE